MSSISAAREAGMPAPTIASQSEESIVAVFFWRRISYSFSPFVTLIESSASLKTTYWEMLCSYTR